MVLLAFLMLSPSDSFPDSKLLSFDKLGHLGVFAILFLLLVVAFTKQKQYAFFKNKARNLALTISIVYATLLEFLQKFAEGRAFDWLDIVANISGVVMGLIFFFVFSKKLFGIHKLIL